MMNGFHSACRFISAHDSARTTGKNSANWTVGKSKLEQGTNQGSSRNNRASSTRLRSRSSRPISKPAADFRSAWIATRSRVPSSSVISTRAAGSSMRTRM